MIAFILGTILGGALGMLLMGILQSIDYDYPEEEDDDK